MTVDAKTARQCWRALETVHGLVYFVPEANEEYAAIGLRGNRMGYFASRSAAMGAVDAEVVIATFFNFEPGLVRRAMDGAWSLATPEQVLAARTRVVDRALRRGVGDLVDAPETIELADLLRRAAEAATAHPEGRPLFAGHARLPWPEEPHLVLWHAQTLLREFRGDAHVAALTLEGLTGLEALVSHAAAGDVPADVLRFSRAWSEEAWAEAINGMRRRGLLTDGPDLAFSDAGRRQRDWIESRTDERSVAAYEPLGDDGCRRLRELGRQFSATVVERGLLVVDFSRVDD